MTDHPILYSFRRCPFAIRARMTLFACNITCELREVVLRDKPQEMITISPKATVPVLELSSGEVIDESQDIINWAVTENDPNGWSRYLDEMNALIEINDTLFKIHLDKYKYASRSPELSMEEHRSNGEFFLKQLDDILSQKKFLSEDIQTVTDLAIFPFIRQFAFVDKNVFDGLPFPFLQNWLERNLQSPLFNSVMNKYTQWQDGDEKIFFA